MGEGVGGQARAGRQEVRRGMGSRHGVVPSTGVEWTANVRWAWRGSERSVRGYGGWHFWPRDTLGQSAACPISMRQGASDPPSLRVTGLGVQLLVRQDAQTVAPRGRWLGNVVNSARGGTDARLASGGVDSRGARPLSRVQCECAARLRAPGHFPAPLWPASPFVLLVALWRAG